MIPKTTQSSKLLKLISIAILGSISLVLFFISFPLPFLPTPYLKVDFSDVPALIAALVFSPLAGVLVVFIKNMLYFVVSGASDPIGVVANFIAGIMFIVPVAIFYHKNKGIKSVVIGLIVGTLVMALGMSLLNYVLILPAYSWLVGMEMNEQIKRFSVIAGILPFNVIKGIIVALMFIPLFMKLRSWIEQKQVKTI